MDGLDDFEWRDGVLRPGRGRPGATGSGAGDSPALDPIVKDLVDKHCDGGLLRDTRIQLGEIAEMVRLSREIRELTDEMDDAMEGRTVSAS